MYEEWQRQREELNHLWLKNDFVERVNAFINRLEQQNPNQNKISEFLQIHLPVWEKRSHDLRKLLDNAECALSPKQLFQVHPLLLCSSETKAWLPELIHALWLKRYSIQQLVESANQYLELADFLYASVKFELQESVNTTNFSRKMNTKITFQNFKDSLRALSDAISALPHSIKVV